MRDLLRRKPPAGAWNILRRGVDMFFETHQLPIAGRAHEAKAGFAGKTNHHVVGAQGISEQALSAEGGGAALQIPQYRRADSLPLPAVLDRQAEFETAGIG